MENKRDHFIRDLCQLLNFHGVIIDVDHHWEGYAECGPDIRATAYFDDYEIFSVNLGMYISKDFELGED